MVSEINIIIKDEEKRLNKKFLIYDTYQVDENDKTIRECIEETLKNFCGEPTNIKVNITMDIE